MKFVGGIPRRQTKKTKRTWTRAIILREISAATPKPGTVDPADRRAVRTMAEIAITPSAPEELEGGQSFGAHISDMLGDGGRG